MMYNDSVEYSFASLSVQELRERLPAVIRSLEKGENFTLIYRSRPVGRLIPMEGAGRPRSGLFDLLASPPKSLLFRSARSSVRLVRRER